MTATTTLGIGIVGRGIVYSLGHDDSIAPTATVNFDMGLQGGVDQDNTTWLGATYPGTLDSFEPQQTDRANVFNPRLISVTLSALLKSTDSLTLSGSCSKIMGAWTSHTDATAILGVVKTSDLKLTFSILQHDDSAVDQTGVELLMLVV
tara:strand:- start:82 stop:528 length:447 start_codon:yes stop_codon:yes gene_type:complete